MIDRVKPATQRWVAVLLCLCAATMNQLQAQDAATRPPTFGALVEDAKPGDFLKFRQTQKQGPRSQTTTMWQVFQGKPNAETAVILTVLTDLPETPLEPPTQQNARVRMGQGAVPLAQPVISFAPPPNAGMELLKLDYSESPDQTIMVDKQSYTCRKLELVATVKVQGRDAVYTQTAWISDKLPFTGLVKMENAWTGAIQNSSTLELVGYTGSDLLAIDRASPAWFALHAQRAGAEHILATYNNAAPSSVQWSSYDDFRSLLVAASAWTGDFETAKQITEDITHNDIYRKIARQDLTAAAAVADQKEIVATYNDNTRLTTEQAMSHWNKLYFSNHPGFAGHRDLQDIMTILQRVSTENSAQLHAKDQALAVLIDADRPDDVLAFIDSQLVGFQEVLRGHAMWYARQAGGHDDLIATLWEGRSEKPYALTYMGYIGSLHDQGRQVDDTELINPMLQSLDRLAKIADNLVTMEHASELLWDMNFVNAAGVYRAVGSQRRKLAAEQALGAEKAGVTVSHYSWQKVMEGWAQAGEMEEFAKVKELYLSTGGDSRGFMDSAIMLYSAGLTDEAMALVAEIRAPDDAKLPFFWDGAQALALVEIGRHVRDHLNDQQKADAFFAQALDIMAEAEKKLVAYNANPDPTEGRVSWGFGQVIGRDRDKGPAHVRIMRDRIDAQDWDGAHAAMLTIQSHLPYSGFRDDVWRSYLIELALTGNLQALAKAQTDWPVASGGSMSATRELVRMALIHGGQVDAVIAEARAQENDLTKAARLAEIIVELSYLDKPEAAAALLPELTQLQKDQKYPRYETAARVTLARAQAKAGSTAAAIATLAALPAQATMSLDSMGKVNGREGGAWVLEIAWYLALNGVEAAQLAEVMETIPTPGIRAYFGAGAVIGLSGYPVEEAFHEYHVRSRLQGF